MIELSSTEPEFRNKFLSTFSAKCETESQKFIKSVIDKEFMTWGLSDY